MSKKKEETIKPKVRAYEILERVEKTSPIKPKDKLDELIEEEDEELIREAKRLKIQEIIMKRKAKIQEYKKKFGIEEESFSPLLIRELAKLPDDELQKVLRVYAMMKAIDKTSSASILPFLIGFQRANPQAPETAMISFGKMLVDAFSKGVEVASKKEKPATTFDTILKTIVDLMKDREERIIQKIVEKLQPRPSPLEMILLDEQVYNRLKELGFFGGKQTPVTDPKIQLEIEKLRSETQLKLKQMEQQLQLELAKLGLERMKAQQLQQAFRRIGMAAAEAILSAETSGSESSSTSSTTAYECPVCSGIINVPKGAKRVACPSCKTVFEVAE